MILKAYGTSFVHQNDFFFFEDYEKRLIKFLLIQILIDGGFWIGTLELKFSELEIWICLSICDEWKVHTIIFINLTDYLFETIYKVGLLSFF